VAVEVAEEGPLPALVPACEQAAAAAVVVVVVVVVVEVVVEPPLALVPAREQEAVEAEAGEGVPPLVRALESEEAGEVVPVPAEEAK